MRFEIIAIYDMVIFHLPALQRSVLKEKFVFYAKNDSVYFIVVLLMEVHL